MYKLQILTSCSDPQCKNISVYIVIKVLEKLYKTNLNWFLSRGLTVGQSSAQTAKWILTP